MCSVYVRVATAQGNQGIWMFIFPDSEICQKNVKNMNLHREFNSQHRQNFEFFKNKKTFQDCGRCNYNLLTF